MHLEQHGDDVADAVESGRRRLASIDLGGAVEAVRAAVIPERWSRPKRRSRWPLVAVVLLGGTVAAVMMFLLPTWRRAPDDEGVTDAPGVGPDARDQPSPNEPAYAMSGRGRMSEEMSDGEETDS